MNEDEKSSNRLAVLFPEREVLLPGDNKITVRPLSLKDIPKVTNAFGTILSKAAEVKQKVDESKDGGKDNKSPYTEVVAVACTELVELIPYCINCPPEEVPIDAVPEILEIIMEQNVSEDALGKWSALANRVARRFGVDLKKLAELSQGMKA